MVKILEILVESNRDNWRSMLTELIKLDESGVFNKFNVKLEMHLYIGKLHRSDRIVWGLRWYRLQVVQYMIEDIENKQYNYEYQKDIESIKARLIGLRQKWIKQFQKKGIANPFAVLKESIANEYIDAIHRQAYKHCQKNAPYFKKHYIKKLNDYVFDFQTPKQIYFDFKKIYEDWVHNSTRSIDHAREMYENAEKIIDFGDGYSWWSLNVAICNMEGGVMGHCGNSVGGNSDDNILTLRKDVSRGSKSKQKPFLTFVINNGFLVEMRGRADQKPIEKYHRYIIPLLLKDFVKGIEYRAADGVIDFQIGDLNTEDQIKILKQKPRLDPELAKELGLI